MLDYMLEPPEDDDIDEGLDEEYGEYLESTIEYKPMSYNEWIVKTMQDLAYEMGIDPDDEERFA